MTLLIFILRPPLFAIPILVTLRLTVLFMSRMTADTENKISFIHIRCGAEQISFRFREN